MCANGAGFRKSFKDVCHARACKELELRTLDKAFSDRIAERNAPISLFEDYQKRALKFMPSFDMLPHLAGNYPNLKRIDAMLSKY